MDLFCLLDMVEKGAKDGDIGFEDIERTRAELRAALNKEVSLDMDVAQSALWSASLMDEADAFSHPDGLKFGTMLARITPAGTKFDRFFHIFVKESPDGREPGQLDREGGWSQDGYGGRGVGRSRRLRGD